MNLAQLTEKRNKALADASALLAGTEVTAEQRTQFDSYMTEVRSIDADIVRVKAVEDFKAEQRNANPSPRPNPGESNDPEERAEVRNARVKASFRNYLATGVRETRDLTVANSGVAIPQLFDAQVIEAQQSYGEVYNLVDVIRTDNGNPMKIVTSDDTANGLVPLTVGTNAGEADPTLAGKSLQVDNFTTGVIRVDNGFLTDIGFDIEAWIRDKFAMRFYRGASNLIVNGDNGSVASLTASYASKTFTSASTNKLVYGDFVTALANLDPAYQGNAVWAMSNAALGSVLSIVDGNGRPIFLPGYGEAASGFVGTILGRPVKLVTQLPTVGTGNTPILFGDFKQAYRFRQQNPGIGILRLNELFAAGFETGFVGFARVGGVSLQVGNTSPLVGITVK